MGSFSRVLRAGSGLLLCLGLMSCGGSKPVATPAPVTAAAAGDFSLVATPGTLSLTAGGAAQPISVNAVAANGFTGAVEVSITGLPAGVTAQPAMVTLTPGVAQTMTLSAGLKAAVGSALLTLTGTSGALTHAATVAATIAAVPVAPPAPPAPVPPAPVPDFTLSVTPASLNVLAGGAGAQVSVIAAAVNSFSGTVGVSITGLPAGMTASPATLILTPGTAQSTTLTAALAAASATGTVTFTGTSGSLVHTAAVALTLQAAATTAAPDVTTYHDDVARDGVNAQETILTQANVNSTQFGKIGFDAVDGKVDAEPLYVANVIVGAQFHNVLYVVSEHDSVYAFDADTGAQLWKSSVLGSGEATSDDHGCGQITPEIGITSTPVIDRKQGTNGMIFVVGMSKDGRGGYHQRLHALDLTTGAESSGGPTEIAASYPGMGANTQNGRVVFDPAQYAERAGLLLLNGTIYTAWTSHCDQGQYTGWVMGYSETSLQQTQVIDLTPNGNEGSVWMTGDGLAADNSGNIYFLDANGTFDTTFDMNGFPAQGDYGSAMVKLSTGGGGNGKLAVADYFETYNTYYESDHDEDLGSGGEILLPDLMDSGGGVHHLMVGAGKDATIYLADRDHMGKFNPSTTPVNGNIYQEVTGQLAGQVYATPAYFNGVLYYGAVGDALKAFPMTNAKLATTPSSFSVARFPYPGTTPGISANGTQNGIVWALESSLYSAGVLHAYDPANLAHELYNSEQAANGRDGFGNGNKFITPMIVNGKVYVGTQNGVAVFGLLTH